MVEDYAEKSFWLGNSGAYRENPPLEGDLKCDVAIAGGGFAGIATAYYLKKAQPSLKVAVLEGWVIGWGASGRNAGFAMTTFGLHDVHHQDALRGGEDQAVPPLHGEGGRYSGRAGGGA